ncbi:hypothetical protein [Actinomyces naeslundii]|uniref:hypothetical protein n=1 Tax=Actinomyces naeslundii TaxID=1655 RepID=UPI00242039BA|nr:hypothetical protein [Actinomyces naeslundii]
MSGIQDNQGNPIALKFEGLLRGWLVEEGGARVDIGYQAIHRTGRVKVWLTRGEERKSVHLPREVSFAMHDIRGSQADPHRGAWLWSHFWMEASDGVLHQECDWMREPIIGARSRSNKDAAFELDQFPRDPQWVPEWMAVKAAAYHKEAEKRERRRQRDRERRARKKGEAAGAAEVTGERSGSDASGQVDE